MESFGSQVSVSEEEGSVGQDQDVDFDIVHKPMLPATGNPVNKH